VTTTKYTIFTFLPKNLWEQFQRIANIYFLLVSLLQIFVPDASPTGKYNTFLTLVFVMTVTAAKEGYEDYKRFQADIEQNSMIVKVLRGSRWVKVGWAEVVVGDLVKVEDKEDFPTDMVLVSSSLEEGLCYIETSNLDGETNLKIRRAPKETRDLKEPDQLQGMKGILDCNPPSINMYSYEGRLTTGQGESKKVAALDLENLLMRGCKLRNTQWIVAVVVYTGHDTKIMLNSTPTRFKQSSLEKSANTQIIIIFFFEIFLCLIGTFSSAIWNGIHVEDAWYLMMGPQDYYTVESFITFFILISNLIPISLYVTMELMKIALSMMLEEDLMMYHSESDTRAVARTTNLGEELGQVEYIFSDKTGTLTQNIMLFKKCSISGMQYSDDEGGDIEIAVPEEESGGARQNPPSKGFVSGELSGIIADPANPAHAPVAHFFRILAVCHTVIPDVDAEGKMVYQASSPDDLALVEAAKAVGFEFEARSTEHIKIKVDGEIESYEILSLLDFTSDRKRMSIVVREPNGSINLYCKGADSVVFPLLAPGVGFVDMTIEHLQEFAADGLRTLCVAKKPLEEGMWAEWNDRYVEAKQALDNRDTKMARVMAELEVSLELLGATAIEDKLQDGVPESIMTFLEAGIKVWMLTGDKMETAVNIGFSCKLLDESMLPLLELNVSELDKLEQILDACLEERRLLEEKEMSRPLAVVLGGPAMNTLFNYDDPSTYLLREKFVTVVKEAKAVVGCRCSPIQKAEVVELIQGALDTITLGIGDGANDVSMLQAAHVGVGISGREGLQAVNSSDYAIAQFEYLRPLLLVHGRQAYRKLAKLILYCFYKQVVFNLPLYFYSISAGWSGQSVYEPWSMTVFNVLFTALPIMFFALLDQDVPARAMYIKPSLYKTGHTSYYFSSYSMLYWMLSGIWHAIIILWVVSGTYREVTSSQGHTNSTCYDLGVVIYTIIVLVLTGKLMLETHYFTTYNWVALGFSIVMWYLWCFSVHLWVNFIPETTGTIYHLARTAGYWFCIILAPTVALMRDAVWKVVKRIYFPQPYHLVQEAIHYGIPIEDVDLQSVGREGILQKALFAKAARAAAYTKSVMGSGSAYDAAPNPAQDGRENNPLNVGS